MQIHITDALAQTKIFGLFLIIILLLSVKKRLPLKFDSRLTEELKGLAILAVVFSHIGYFLAADHRFLFPLSAAAGVGVNLFLFLSGYGLTLSAAKNRLTVGQFYLKRLPKLFIPLWLSLAAFFLIDFFILGRGYPGGYIARSFAGVFLTADLARDIDSPLWYFTMILFFYLLFPQILKTGRIFISGVVLLVVSFVLLKARLPAGPDNINLYRLHFIPFPLGMVFASVNDKFGPIVPFLSSGRLRAVLFAALVLTFGYLAIHSGVGEGKAKEQAVSLLSVMVILAAFLIKNFQFGLLNLTGRYSYEIYLLHWPILARYQNLYAVFPASQATGFYLAEFLLLGAILQTASLGLTRLYSAALGQNNG